MTVRRLDANGDLVTQGQQFLNGVQEVEQTVRTRLNLFLGEYFRDVTDGTPWYEQILGKFASLSAAEAALRARIANTPDVIRLTRFDSQFDIQTRKYDVQASILTIYGEGEVRLTDPFGPVDPTPVVPVIEEQVVINELAVVV
tara:strand:+ start:5250 stop:5678 length:429 start_codon:yes stop_codon:yes gene_type:complete